MKRFVSKVMKLPDSACRMVSGGKTEIDGQVLDGRAQLLLHELAKRYEPYNTMEPVEARAHLDTIRERGPPAPDFCSVEDAHLSGASASGMEKGSPTIVVAVARESRLTATRWRNRRAARSVSFAR